MPNRLTEIFEDEKLVEKIKKTLTLFVPTCRVRKFKGWENWNGSGFGS